MQSECHVSSPRIRGRSWAQKQLMNQLFLTFSHNHSFHGNERFTSCFNLIFRPLSSSVLRLLEMGIAVLSTAPTFGKVTWMISPLWVQLALPSPQVCSVRISLSHTHTLSLWCQTDKKIFPILFFLMQRRRCRIQSSDQSQRWRNYYFFEHCLRDAILRSKLLQESRRLQADQHPNLRGVHQEPFAFHGHLRLRHDLVTE